MGSSVIEAKSKGLPTIYPQFDQFVAIQPGGLPKLWRIRNEDCTFVNS